MSNNLVTSRKSFEDELSKPRLVSSSPVPVAISAPVVPESISQDISLGTLRADSPRALIESATNLATELAHVINTQHLAVSIQGKNYVKSEGWTTLAILLGCVAREASTVFKDGIYISIVELIEVGTGKLISRASAECGDELPWKTRPQFMRRSMAQTRATSKACRLAFAWVVTLAGYEPTPAEEMEMVEYRQAPPQPVPQSQPEPPLQKVAPLQTEPSPQIDQTIKKITEAQKRLLEGLISKSGLNRDWVKEQITQVWGIKHFYDLTPDQLDKLIKQIRKWEATLREKIREKMDSDCPF